MEIMLAPYYQQNPEEVGDQVLKWPFNRLLC